MAIGPDLPKSCAPVATIPRCSDLEKRPSTLCGGHIPQLQKSSLSSTSHRKIVTFCEKSHGANIENFQYCLIFMFSDNGMKL
jgi:hypothetical protein